MQYGGLNLLRKYVSTFFYRIEQFINTLRNFISLHLEEKSIRYDGFLGVKSKAVPLQAWTGPEGSRKLRFPDFVTTAQDGGKVVSLMHRPPLPPGNAPGTHFC